MEEEYIIVNKTALKKRIEELEKMGHEKPWLQANCYLLFAKAELEQILSQSIVNKTALEKRIEELEKNGAEKICFLSFAKAELEQQLSQPTLLVYVPKQKESDWDRPKAVKHLKSSVYSAFVLDSSGYAIKKG